MIRSLYLLMGQALAVGQKLVRSTSVMTDLSIGQLVTLSKPGCRRVVPAYWYVAKKLEWVLTTIYVTSKSVGIAHRRCFVLVFVCVSDIFI